MKALARVQLLAAAALIGAAAVLSAACGGVSVDPVAQAATQTQSVSSYRFTMSGSTTLPNVGVMNMSGDGMWSGDSERMQMTMHYSVPAGQGAREAFDANAVMDLGGGGTVMYMSMPLITQELPDGKTWLKLDFGRIGAVNGVDLSSVMQSNQADPRKALTLLSKSGEKTDLGPETIDGVATTHYRVDVDVAKLAANQPTDAARSSLQKVIEQTGLSHYPIDVWVGDDKLVHQLRFDLTTKVAGLTAPVRMTMVERLSAFDSPVAVDLPPADGVYDATDEVKRAAANGSLNAP